MKEIIIPKKCIFITSGGRTATKFLSVLLAVSFKSCHSVQEPDIWRVDDFYDFYRNKSNFIHKLIDFGFFNMTIGKLFSLGNMRSITIARQRGKIDEEEAAKRLYLLRHDYISKLKQDIYIESNLQLAGLIDIIPLVFPNSKTVFIIRDGRNWVRSYLNIQATTIYTMSDPLFYLPHARLSAKIFPDDPFSHRWNKFSAFQRICWLWRFQTEYAIKTIKKNPNATIVKYESLFESSNEYESLNNFLKNLTKFSNNYQAEFQYNDELSGKRLHESKADRLQKWEKWPLNLVREFQEICGDLLLQQGYGTESLWHEMILKSEQE